MYGILRLGTPDSLITLSGKVNRCKNGEVTFTMHADEGSLLKMVYGLGSHPLYLEVTDKPLKREDNPHFKYKTRKKSGGMWYDLTPSQQAQEDATELYNQMEAMCHPRVVYALKVEDIELCEVGTHNLKFRFSSTGKITI